MLTNCKYHLYIKQFAGFALGQTGLITFWGLKNKQHKELLIDYYHRMNEKGINQKDQIFKDKILMASYLNALKAVYSYALNCHKSQGGECNKVFLYLNNKVHLIFKPSIYQWMHYCNLCRKNFTYCK